MNITIQTQVVLNFSIDEYEQLIVELSDYIYNNSNTLTSLLDTLHMDLEDNYRKLSNFTIQTSFEVKSLSDMFKNKINDIEEVDPDNYPILSDLFLTLFNKIQ